MSSKRKMNRTKVEKQRKTHRENESVKLEMIRRVTESEDPLRDELLRGIPNHVTLKYIATQLPRRAYEEVAKVNADWQRAFQNRMVYDARVHYQTTQTFLVVSCAISTLVDYRDDFGKAIRRSVFRNTLSLFSPTENRWYKCPPIPGCKDDGMLFNPRHAVLDGKIYVFGGTRIRNFRDDIPCAEVLVLDFGAQPLEWRRCASMLAPRRRFTVGVMNGKIFVFGGFARHTYHYEVRNEMYDPTVDAWSFIAPTMPSASVQHVYSIGQQFFACIGWTSDPKPEVGEPLIDGEADLCPCKKIVVRVYDSGPKLICTGHDDDDDDMNGLHQIIEKYPLTIRGDYMGDRPEGYSLTIGGERVGHRQGSPAESLASEIRNSTHTKSFLGFYVPDKDEWRTFENERLGTDVDFGQPSSPSFNLLRLIELSGPGRHNHALASVRSISL